MDETLKNELRRVQVTIQAIVGSFQDPCTPYKILKEYNEEYGNLPFNKFGFTSVEHFLQNHPNLYATRDTQGRIAYKATVTSANGAAQDILEDVARQKKKKKNGRGGYFNRYSSSRSRHTMTNTQYQFRNSYLQSRGGLISNITNFLAQQRQPMATTSAPIPKNTYGTVRRPNVLQALSLLPTGYFDPNYAQKKRPTQKLTDQGSAHHTPEEGARRILDVLNALGGAARLNKFAQRYRERHQCDFDANELQKYFGTGKLSVVRKTMEDQLTFISLGEKEILMKTTKFIQAEKQQQVSNTVDALPAPKTPTLPELQEHITLQLTMCYPQPIPLADVGTYYSRHFGIEIDPVALYAKKWESLFSQTFSGRTVVENGNIYLNPKYVADKGIKRHQDGVSGLTKINNQLEVLNDLDETSSDETETDVECNETGETDNLTPLPTFSNGSTRGNLLFKYQMFKKHGEEKQGEPEVRVTNSRGSISELLNSHKNNMALNGNKDENNIELMAGTFAKMSLGTAKDEQSNCEKEVEKRLAQGKACLAKRMAGVRGTTPTLAETSVASLLIPRALRQV